MAVASGRIAGERQGQQTCQAFINARSRVREMNRKRISPALCLFVLSTGGLPTAPAQIPPGGVKDRPQFAPLPVRIRQDSGVTSRWKLLHAALQESIIGVWGCSTSKMLRLLRCNGIESTPNTLTRPVGFQAAGRTLPLLR
jgi:hypothetical protein